MAESTPVALEAAPAIPSAETIERAAAFTREPFLLDGEDAASQLAPGSARRRALDAAVAEIEAGAKVPSVAWRQRWSLLLGLDRLLSVEEPKLADGTVLSAHQVDALSGTLTALLAESGNGGSSNGRAQSEPAPLASVGIPGEEEDEEEDEPEEPQDWEDEAAAEAEDAEQLGEAPEDPNAGKRFWFEHATGAGKTVAALGFVEGSRTGGILILTHRRNLVDQFLGELRDRGYAKRISPPLVRGQDRADGPVTVETYQWFVRNAGNVSDAYTIVICDEAHTALGEKTSASIRNWHEPVFIGMTATGALIARHVTDLFPTQTSRFDLAQAARRGVIAPLRCVRIPPGPGVRTIAKVPLRRGEVDTEFDQEMLAELLDQLPFNLAVADLYKTRFNGVPGVVYAAGVRHAYNVAEAFRDVGLKAQAVSGETPKRELAQILARYERGDVDVLVNAQLLAEGWNSPRATVCMHLAPTASKRIYQQRVGRVTRRHPGKEAGIVVDFVHPATKHDDPVVTLHSLLDREVYRGGAIVVGPVRRGRGRRLRVERRVLPVTADENRRIEVFERELWRIAVEHLDYGEQVQWAALAGARVTPAGWRRARAMLHFDQGGELKRTFLITAVDRNKNAQLRLRALQEIAASRDAEAFDRALDFVESWPRDDKREGVKVVLQALAEKKIGRRDQANNWIWRCANMTREVHEEYAVQRWPETKRLLGLLVNSSGGAHARNARRLVHAARQQDRRLSAALLAAAIPHTAEASEVVNGARTRMSRKPAALARELLRNFPKGKGRRGNRRRKKKGAPEGVAPEVAVTPEVTAVLEEAVDSVQLPDAAPSPLLAAAAAVEAAALGADEPAEETPKPAAKRRRSAKNADADAEAKPKAKAKAKPRRTKKAAEPVEVAPAAEGAVDAVAAPAEPIADAAASEEAPKPAKRRRTAKKADEDAAPKAKPAAKRRRTTEQAGPAEAGEAAAEPAKRGRTTTQGEAGEAAAKPAKRGRATTAAEAGDAAGKPAKRRRTAKPAGDDAADAAPKRAAQRRVVTQAVDEAVEVPPAAEPVAGETAAPKRAPRRRAVKAAEDVIAPADEAPKRAPRRRAVKAPEAA
jgi:ribonuclease E